MKPLVVALMLSISGHGGGWGAYLLFREVARIYHATHPDKAAELRRQQQAKAKAMERREEVPLIFLETDPTATPVEAPKDAKYYAARNSQAANPDPKIETDTPRIDGSQEHVPKTESAPRSKAVPLQPAAPKPADGEAEALAKPKTGPAIGDLAMAKPAPKPADGKVDPQVGEAQETTHKRPRTLAEAKMQNSTPGEKMKQDGGVLRGNMASSLNAKGTPFGEYDAAIVQAIQSRWYDLLEAQRFSKESTGKVVLEFKLNYDGRITDMKVVENGVDDLLAYLCQRAILDPAPYAPWPSDMRRLINGDYREVRFTFFYD